MPYLTRPVGAASTASGLGFAVPGFAHPLLAPVEWTGLTRPGVPLHWVALNVAGGPGTRPDPQCLDAVGRVRNTGVRVVGHLDAVFGARGFGDLVREARRYLDWYQVDGFVLGRCPVERGELAEVRRTVSTLRALRPGAHIVLGHGTHPDPGYAEVGDQLVTFSGSWSEYRWSQVAEWTADHPAARFCHFVHGVPRGHLDEALRIARWQGAGTIYFTDRRNEAGTASAWEGVPGYWDEIVSLIGTGVSE